MQYICSVHQGKALLRQPFKFILKEFEKDPSSDKNQALLDEEWKDDWGND